MEIFMNPSLSRSHVGGASAGVDTSPGVENCLLREFEQSGEIENLVKHHILSVTDLQHIINLNASDLLYRQMQFIIELCIVPLKQD